MSAGPFLWLLESVGTYYVLIGLHLPRRYIGLLFSFSLLPPFIEAHVWYDLVADPCMIQSYGWFLYDIYLGATTTTILSIRGVMIPIDLVSSATDSIKRRVGLFKSVPIPTSDPKSEFLCQSSLVVQNLQTLWIHLVCLGYLPHPRNHVSPLLPQSWCSHRVSEGETMPTMG